MIVTKFVTLNSVGREGFMDKMSFKQNPVGGEGSSLQVPRGRKRQAKRSCAGHFQRGVRRPVWLAEQKRGGVDEIRQVMGGLGHGADSRGPCRPL